MGDNSNIDIYLRIKPVKNPSPRLVLDSSESKIEFNVPREQSAGLVNNQRENYEFRFNGLIMPEAKQDEVFERVARHVVMGALEGINGTLFAYGQTGSGKTFTITGGPERYVDRGIIPRTLSAMFAEITKRSDYRYTVRISYLEIYNETGYDLLDPSREVKSMEDLPQVAFRDVDGDLTLQGLSSHVANNDEEALNLLFLGDTNRTISETPMNMASSRSHCVFTIQITAAKVGDDLVRTSKLNLVDLAGSERVSKTGVDGTTLREAKFINLSLHYLEQVIIALQERASGLHRPHIPYRNSKMTMMLRDSLGGNCRTVMVATVSGANDQLDESISTCRFAQRVAMVRNQVMVNEELDPTLMIRRLKQEIRDLKEEVRLLNGQDEVRGPLTPDELARLSTQVAAFCGDKSGEVALQLNGSMMMVRAVLDIFKQMVVAGGDASGQGAAAGPATPGAVAGAGPAGAGPGGPGGSADALEQIRKLKLQVQQRDNEINILVSMLKRRENGRGPQLGGSGADSPSSAAAGAAGGDSASPSGAGAGRGGREGSSSTQSPMGPLPPRGPGAGGSPSVSGSQDDMANLMNPQLLADRNTSFELFRKSYRQNEVIEENKALLKQKYDEAKASAAVVNESKGRINQLKSAIEQRRVQRALGPHDDAQDDPEETRLKALIEREKGQYRDAFDRLRDQKCDIDRLHQLLDQSRRRLLHDFEGWQAIQARQGQQPRQQQGSNEQGGGTPTSVRGSSPSGPPPPAAPRAAWGERASPSSPSPSAAAGGAALNRSLSSNNGSRAALPSSSSSPDGGRWAAPVARTDASGVRGSAASLSSQWPGVEPEVLAMAAPHLTGLPDADDEIIRFYQASAAVRRQQQMQQG